MMLDHEQRSHLFCWTELMRALQLLFLCLGIHPLTLSPALDAEQKVSDAEDQPLQK